MRCPITSNLKFALIVLICYQALLNTKTLMLLCLLVCYKALSNLIYVKKLMLKMAVHFKISLNKIIGKIEEQLPPKLDGRLLVNGWSTIGRQTDNRWPANDQQTADKPLTIVLLYMVYVCYFINLISSFVLSKLPVCLTSQ